MKDTSAGYTSGKDLYVNILANMYATIDTKLSLVTGHHRVEATELHGQLKNEIGSELYDKPKSGTITYACLKFLASRLESITNDACQSPSLPLTIVDDVLGSNYPPEKAYLLLLSFNTAYDTFVNNLLTGNRKEAVYYLSQYVSAQEISLSNAYIPTEAPKKPVHSQRPPNGKPRQRNSDSSKPNVWGSFSSFLSGMFKKK